jgi:hypothetical protein
MTSVRLGSYVSVRCLRIAEPRRTARSGGGTLSPTTLRSSRFALSVLADFGGAVQCRRPPQTVGFEGPTPSR